MNMAEIISRGHVEDEFEAHKVVGSQFAPLISFTPNFALVNVALNEP